MEYNHNICFIKLVFWQMMLSLTSLWWDQIVLRLRSSSSCYAPLAIWGINWRFDYDLCNQVAICLRSEQIATDLCASESTDGDLGDHGDQLETNQRSINVLGDASALPGALWHSHRAPSGMGVLYGFKEQDNLSSLKATEWVKDNLCIYS